MEGKCPFCVADADITSIIDGIEVRCRRCGHFQISKTFEATLDGQKMDPNEKALLQYLACYIRRENETNNAPVILPAHKWRDLAEGEKKTRTTVKIIKALEWLASRSAPGNRVDLNLDTESPLVGAVSGGELTILLDHLEALGYISWSNRERNSCFVTGKGWEHLESLSITAGVPGRCFVAMSFDPSLAEAYQSGIYLAVKEDCKMEPVRIDLVHHNEKICDKIIAEIRMSQFVVADVTRQRPGVYFEAGFAMGLGRPVIWTCRKNDLANVHFDTRQYNHIVWERPEDLREKVTDRIRATILKN